MTGEAPRGGVLREELASLRKQLTGAVPVEEIHEELDTLGVPRTKDRRKLFLRERFALLRSQREKKH